ncbi:Tyrosine-protein kinase transforming protein RYK [Halotydeus destructor]|nr:Tyrosine-protein kinase transforming protein RYK [Halotydeus destructor]
MTQIVQFKPRKAEMIVKMLSTGNTVALFGSQDSLIVVKPFSLTRLSYAKCEESSLPLVTGVRPDILQVGTVRNITYYARDVTPLGYHSMVYIDKTKCMPQKLERSSHDTEFSCELAEPFTYARDLDFVIKVFYSQLQVSSVVFKKRIKARNIVLQTSSAEAINDLELLVSVTGRYLVGAEQIFELDGNCDLLHETPTELKFRCSKPDCWEDEPYHVFQGYLRIGDFETFVNVSGVVCVGGTPDNDSVLILAISCVCLAVLFTLVFRFKKVACFGLRERSMLSSFSMRRLWNSIEMDIYDERALQRKQPLKQGFHGTIYEGTLQLRKGTSMAVAMKQLKNSECHEELRAEAEMMACLDHPNIVECIGLSMLNRKPELLIMPLFKNGDLRSFVNRYPPTIGFALKVFIDIAKGVSYLSARGVVHRDLAARNILLTDALGAKIADFGLASNLESDGTASLKNIKVAIRWLAIECFTDKKYTAAADIWSFGIIMWEVFSRGRMPYPEVGDDDIIEHIQDGNQNRQPFGVPDWLMELMDCCWNVTPAERPAIEDILSVFYDQRRNEAQGEYSAMALLMDDYATCHDRDTPIEEEPVLYSNIYVNVLDH